MNYIKIYIGAILTLIVNMVSGQTFNESDFIETNQPNVPSKEWTQLNHSRNEFSVSIVNDSLIIDESKKFKTELLVKKGRLVGTDNGEWGGQLIFESNKWSYGERKIKKGNIRAIFQLNNQIYFVEGLAHMRSSSGALYSLSRNKNKFTYEKLIDFDDAPEAITVHNDIIYIASHESFFIIRNLKKETVFKKTFWSSLYPNSIAIKNEKNIFIGIRSGYVKLNAIEKKITFYKYKQ